RDWSSDVCSSDLIGGGIALLGTLGTLHALRRAGGRLEAHRRVAVARRRVDPLAVRIAGLHRGAGAPLGAGDALAAAGARGAIADEGAALRRAPRGRRVAHADLATRDALGAERRALTAAVALRADELTRCLRAGLPGDAVAGDDDRVFGGAG